MTASTRTNGAASATVETLTAEVRALMIGNRQVTLSVYRQLDTVPYDELEPFGRVRDNQDLVSRDVDRVYIVGKHTTTGALVRSRICVNQRGQCDFAPTVREHVLYHHKSGRDCEPIMTRDDSLTIGSTILRNRPVIWVIERGVDLAAACDAPTFDEPEPSGTEVRNGTVYAVDNPAWAVWRDAQSAHYDRRWRGDHCDLDALGAQIEVRKHNDVLAARRTEEQFEAATALPLIVLAGLR